MEIAISRAQRMKIHWHVHIDTDELLYPGRAVLYSLYSISGV
jgi:hypothetical protein